VDVLLTGNPGGGNDAQTTTVLENVAVIAAGQKLERNAAGDPQTTPVITLLVAPDDAQRLTLAAAQGKIQLALRNPMDTKPTGPATTRTGGLFGLPVAPVPHPKVVTKKVVPAAPSQPEPWKIVVIRGNKVDETKISDQDQLGAH